MLYGVMKSDAYFDTLKNESGRVILVDLMRRNFTSGNRSGTMRLFHLFAKC